MADQAKAFYELKRNTLLVVVPKGFLQFKQLTKQNMKQAKKINMKENDEKAQKGIFN